MGIHRLLYSSFCFLNINTATTRQLIRTARTLEAEWWQVCGKAWVQGQREMSQILGAFGLLDFTVLRPAWRAFLNLGNVYFFNFPFFFRAASNRGYWIRGYGGPPVSVYCKFILCSIRGDDTRSIIKKYYAREWTGYALATNGVKKLGTVPNLRVP